MKRVLSVLVMMVLLGSVAQAALMKDTLRVGETRSFLAGEDRYDVELVLVDDRGDGDIRALLSVNGVEETFREADEEDFGGDFRIIMDEIYPGEGDGLVEYYVSVPGDLAVIENETNASENGTVEFTLSPDVVYVAEGYEFGINEIEGGQVRFATEDGLTPYYDEGDVFTYRGVEFEIVGIGEDVTLRAAVEPEALSCVEVLVCAEDGEWRPNACAAFLEGVEVVDDSFCETCGDEYEPVCGEDGVTYDNACLAEEANASVDYEGECETCTAPDVEQGLGGSGSALLEAGVEHVIVVGGREFAVEWSGEVMESYPEQYRLSIEGRSVTLTRSQERTFSTDAYELTVEAGRVTDCGYLIVEFALDEDPDVPGFPGGDEVRIALDKGWNLITLPGRLQRFVATGDEKVLGYVWVVERGRYYSIQEARDLLGDRFKDYLATHAFWVYSYGAQSLVVEVEPVDVGEIGVEEGWNLLPIIAPFVGESVVSLDGACSLGGAYVWNSKRQEWRSWSKDADFTRAMVGEGLLLRSANGCTLAGGVVQPPVFPGFPDDSVDDSDDDWGRVMNHGQVVSAVASSKSQGRVSGWIPPGQAKKLVKIKYKDGGYEVEWEDEDEDD